MSDTEKAKPRLRASIKIEEITTGVTRAGIINTTVVAKDLGQLKRKVAGIIDLMTDDDIEGAQR